MQWKHVKGGGFHLQLWRDLFQFSTIFTIHLNNFVFSTGQKMFCTKDVEC